MGVIRDAIEEALEPVVVWWHRCRHAGGHHPAEQLQRVCFVCRGLSAQQRFADSCGSADRIFWGHPFLHHVQGDPMQFSSQPRKRSEFLVID